MIIWYDAYIISSISRSCTSVSSVTLKSADKYIDGLCVHTCIQFAVRVLQTLGSQRFTRSRVIKLCIFSLVDTNMVLSCINFLYAGHIYGSLFDENSGISYDFVGPTKIPIHIF